MDQNMETTLVWGLGLSRGYLGIFRIFFIDRKKAGTIM